MAIKETLKKVLPDPLCALFRHFKPKTVDPTRKESNQWLRQHCHSLKGRILSVGGHDDSDGEGHHYSSYFSNCSEYITSDIRPNDAVGLLLDIRSMPQIDTESFDVIFCSGVLEHVDDCHKGIQEMTRILKKGGYLLLGTPFRQAIHLAPNDYWRFTKFGIRYLFSDHYEIIELAAIHEKEKGFPSAYWMKARKK